MLGFIFIIFCLNLVSASYDNIEGFEFLGVRQIYNPACSCLMDSYNYRDSASNLKYVIQILKYENETKINKLVSSRMKDSSKFKIEKNNIFEQKFYIFWRNNNNIIQIVDINAMYQYYNKNNLNPYFPDKLIEEFLFLYPSDCDSQGCLDDNFKLKNKIHEDLKWFFEEYDYEDYEICESEDNCSIPEPVVICFSNLMDYLKTQLTEKDFEIFQSEKDMVMEECARREAFINAHANFDKNYLDLLFEEQDKRFLRDVEFRLEFKAEHEDKSSLPLRIYHNGSIVELKNNKNISNKTPLFKKILNTLFNLFK